MGGNCLIAAIGCPESISSNPSSFPGFSLAVIVQELIEVYAFHFQVHQRNASSGNSSLLPPMMSKIN